MSGSWNTILVDRPAHRDSGVRGNSRTDTGGGMSPNPGCAGRYAGVVHSRCVCESTTGLVVALASEVLTGCTRRLDRQRPVTDIERRIRFHLPRLTPAARGALSIIFGGGSPANIAASIANGRLVLVEARASSPRAGMTPRKPETPPPVEVLESPKTTSWIKFQLVHHVTGEPFAGVQLSVRIPSGLELHCETDKTGFASINDIDPGACDVWCDLKGARLSRTVAFVGVGRPAPRDPLAPAPLPRSTWGARSTWLAHVDEHKVRTGESLKSIAAQYSYNWKELAEFNWDTSLPDEVNEHLRDDVGCTMRTPDGMNYRFSSEDEPGLIYIPRPWWQNGLQTDQEHVIRVRLAAGFRLILENQDELRIPEAEYEATFSDGSTRKGRLGRGGVALIKDPPPGPVDVFYPDLDDIEAKSLAACVRRAMDRRDLREVFRMLKHSRWMIRESISAYDRYYNDYTGEGLLADIDQEATDAHDRFGVEALLRIADLHEEPGDKDGAADSADQASLDAEEAP